MIEARGEERPSAPAGAAHRQRRPNRGPTRRAPHPLLRTWLLAFAALFVASAAWSLATPLGAAPDEPTQLERAAAVVRGQLTGVRVDVRGTPGSRLYLELQNLQRLTVPEVFADLGPLTVNGVKTGYIDCFQFRPTVPAGCAPKLWTSRQQVQVNTYVGNYPPFYYLWVGTPTLAAVSVTGIRLARLASCLLASIFLALAVCSVRRARGTPLLAAGVAVAITPLVLFLSSVINPSGFEIATAISAWAAAMALWSTPPDQIGRSQVTILGVSLAAVALSRSLGPLWVAAVLVVLVLLGLQGRWRPFLARRDVRGWMALVAAAVVATGIWDVVEHGFRTEPGTAVPHGTSVLTVFGEEFSRLPGYVDQSIGVFGWLELSSPFGVYAIWLFCLGVLGLLALSTGFARRTVTALAVVVAWGALAVCSGLLSARSRGILGQGRDFLAIGVAIPIVCAALAAGVLRPSAARRLARAAIVLVVAGQMVDFYWALRRYMVGSRGPLDLFAHVKDGWHPPLPAGVLIAAFVVATAAYGFVLFRSGRTSPVDSPAEAAPQAEQRQPAAAVTGG